MPSLVIVSPLTARVPAVVIFPEASTWNALAVPEVNVPLASRFPVISVLPLIFVTPSRYIFPVVLPPRVRVLFLSDLNSRS